MISVFNDPVLEDIIYYITQLRCMQEKKKNYMQVIQFATILFEIIVVVVNDLIK